MKFGLHFQLPCSGNQNPIQRYQETLAQAAHAETLGFESVWPVEQPFNWVLGDLAPLSELGQKGPE
jgi:alkanesulfonate monooxygenase SsuD/methylene tetrahydromethanopterin reductase-like flavin-dependent oxidoreductase (luciferase family)